MHVSQVTQSVDRRARRTCQVGVRIASRQCCHWVMHCLMGRCYYDGRVASRENATKQVAQVKACRRRIGSARDAFGVDQCTCQSWTARRWCNRSIINSHLISSEHSGSCYHLQTITRSQKRQTPEACIASGVCAGLCQIGDPNAATADFTIRPLSAIL